MLCFPSPTRARSVGMFDSTPPQVQQEHRLARVRRYSAYVRLCTRGYLVSDGSGTSTSSTFVGRGTTYDVHSSPSELYLYRYQRCNLLSDFHCPCVRVCVCITWRCVAGRGAADLDAGLAPRRLARRARACAREYTACFINMLPLEVPR